MMMEPVPSTTPATSPTTAEVRGIPSPDEAPGMAGVPDPERANGSIWCYGKGKSIIIDKIEKNQNLGKSKNKIAQKGNAAKKLVKNWSKTTGRKLGVY